MSSLSITTSSGGRHSSHYGTSTRSSSPLSPPPDTSSYPHTPRLTSTPPCTTLPAPVSTPDSAPDSAPDSGLASAADSVLNSDAPSTSASHIDASMETADSSSVLDNHDNKSDQGNLHRKFHPKSVDAANQIMTEFLHNPLSLSSPTVLKEVRWVHSGQSGTLARAGTSPPVAAELRLIGELSDTRYLTPDGGYRQKYEIHKEPYHALIRHRTSGFLVAPRLEELHQHWEASLKNLTQLTALAKGGRNLKGREPVDLVGISDRGIKIRHQLFERIGVDYSVEEAANNTNSDLTFDEYKIYCGDEVQEGLSFLEASGEYRINPLPAFTLNGKPIHPREWADLKGCLLLVEIVLTYKFYAGALDIYADIANITRLRKAGYGPAVHSPISRKRILEAPSYLTQNKRPRTV